MSRLPWRWLLATAGLAALVGCAPAVSGGARIPGTTPGIASPFVTSPAPSRETSLIGLWQAHSFTLAIDATGIASAAWRTNRWCGPGAPPPCDGMIASHITPGGRATLFLHPAQALWTDAAVVESTDPSSLPLGPVRLLPVADDQLRLFLGSDGARMVRVNLCRAQTARATDCGA